MKELNKGSSGKEGQTERERERKRTFPNYSNHIFEIGCYF